MRCSRRHQLPIGRYLNPGASGRRGHIGSRRRSQGDGNGRTRSDAGVAVVTSGTSDAEAVGRAAIFGLIEMALHVPTAAKGLAARGTPVCTPVYVPMVLERAGVFENFTALVASVPTHAVRCHGEGFGN